MLVLDQALFMVFFLVTVILQLLNLQLVIIFVVLLTVQEATTNAYATIHLQHHKTQTTDSLYHV